MTGEQKESLLYHLTNLEKVDIKNINRRFGLSDKVKISLMENGERIEISTLDYTNLLTQSIEGIRKLVNSAKMMLLPSGINSNHNNYDFIEEVSQLQIKVSENQIGNSLSNLGRVVTYLQQYGFLDAEPITEDEKKLARLNEIFEDIIVKHDVLTKIVEEKDKIFNDLNRVKKAYKSSE